MQRIKSCIAILVCIAIPILISSSLSTVNAQEIDSAVEAVFSQLTPEERVGQLFIVSFEGSDVGSDTDIARLIQEYRVGGVFISADNENFTNEQGTPAQVLELINGLQALAQSSLAVTTTATLTSSVSAPAPEANTPLPLFIGVNHEGDGYPTTEIRSGLMEIPNQMALGATWNTENARLVGEAVGYDLSLLGVNMLFGPSLDVLDNPRVDQGNSLGTRTFGGQPYWVGEMGKAYIRGVHEGSDGQVLTIAKHFPGFGSSDREINQEVPTILKSLDDLRQVELYPFFEVTELDSEAPAGTTDGLMTSHVRYQGLQGNVPISLDARNLPALLALDEIAPWRNAGGLIVSAPLGVPAALEGITASSGSFPARRLAQDAFVAGSDILLLVDFAREDDSEIELANIKDTIQFFQERYENDPNFRAAVDRSARRIVKAKIKLYGSDLLSASVQQPESNLSNLGDTEIDLDQIAQAGVTLITPNTQEGLTPLPDPPQPGENILIFTDDRLGQVCPDCPGFRFIRTTALQDIILRLFGPDATGQVSADQITSLSFADLKNMLSEENEDEAAETEALIRSADWIIFAMLNIDIDSYPNSDAVVALLRNRFDDLRNKSLILFAFNAPYFLGETEISQLTGYYGFYSKTRNYLEAAARLLFQQFEPTGASPVAIPAIGPLDLSPDPNQVIQLKPIHKIDGQGNIIEISATGGTIDLEVGEGILFRTSVIVDRHGHPVPDGTTVNFFRSYPLEGLNLGPVQSETQEGVAEIVIIKERDTPLSVRASSDLATQSETFNIGPGIVDTPTATPTSTSTPTNTPTATLDPSPTLTPTDAPTPTSTAMPTTVLMSSTLPRNPVGLVDLVSSLLASLTIGGIAFTLGGDRFALEERVRGALVAVASGLVGYIFFTIIGIAFSQSPIVSNMIRQNTIGHWIAPLITLSFSIVGVLIWHLKPGRVFWKKKLDKGG